MAEHEHGKMDITYNERMFENFIRFSCWVGGLSIMAVIVVAIVNG